MDKKHYYLFYCNTHFIVLVWDLTCSSSNLCVHLKSSACPKPSRGERSQLGRIEPLSYLHFLLRPRAFLGLSLSGFSYQDPKQGSLLPSLHHRAHKVSLG